MMTSLSERPSLFLPAEAPVHLDLATALLVSSYQRQQLQPKLRHIWIITGPAGCGKSSVAAHLAKKLRLPYIEGDEYHPSANIAKMSAGIPLTDDDRWEWLATLRDKAVEELEAGEQGAVVTCSALKRTYRDVIRMAGMASPDVCVRFVYLQANVDLLIERVRQRKDHYMKDDMVRSQFMALEEPDASEPDVVPVDVSRPKDVVFRDALEKVKLHMLRDRS